jgi:hypothetical protein
MSSLAPAPPKSQITPAIWEQPSEKITTPLAPRKKKNPNPFQAGAFAWWLT